MERAETQLFAIGSFVKFKGYQVCPPLMVVNVYGYNSRGKLVLTIKRMNGDFQESCFPQDELESVNNYHVWQQK